MFSRFAFASFLCLGTLCLASPDVRDDCVAAAKKLLESANYSWTSTTEQPNGSAEAAWTSRVEYHEGKTEKAAFTYIKFTFGDTPVEAVTLGSKAAVKIEDAWKPVDRLSSTDPSQPLPARFIGSVLQTFKLPAAQISEYASHLQQVIREGDAFTGQITGPYAASLLPRPGRRNPRAAARPPPNDARLSLRMWIKDGILTKYEAHLTGTIIVNANTRRWDRTTTVEISEVGSTHVPVPEEAKMAIE
jgi:hypothetical protein